MQIFYHPNIVLDTTIELSEEESAHLKVLRKRESDLIQLMNGQGELYASTIVGFSKKNAIVHCQQLLSKTPKSATQLHLAIAPTKNMDRIEWLAEKATEIGVDTISFVLCKNAERKELKLERIHKIVLSAAKQSYHLHLPTIQPIVAFSTFVKENKDAVKLIGYCEEKTQFIYSTFVKEKSHCILIGPEGDFSPAEIAIAKENGFQPVSLGESRLRVETAALYACNAFSVFNNVAI